MELSDLEKLYIINNVVIDENEIINKKRFILKKFEEHRKASEINVPDIYNIDDTLADLEKRYNYYVLKHKDIMEPEDLAIDYMLRGMLILEKSINLNGFTETIILNKKEYKGLIRQICEKYILPNYSNNVLFKLLQKLMTQFIDFTS